jgi:hypothetical protein
LINRQITFLLLFLSLLALVLGSIGGTEELTKSSSETAIPPESVVVPYPIGENPKAGIVQKLFAHRRHAQEFRIACGECHHVYENGKNIWNEGMPIQKCSECHDAPWKGQKNLVTSFQLRIFLDHPSCARCHRKGKGD